VLPVGFLSNYINRIRFFYIGISNITAIEDGAFGGGIFNRITLEDLRLEKIDRAFFTNITTDFKGLSIMQDIVPLKSVYPDFLDNVKFQIEYLRVRTGISCVRNVTATEPTLPALIHADFSYNNFGDQLLYDSFRKLTMVEVLVLSFSNISVLPSFIFKGNVLFYLIIFTILTAFKNVIKVLCIDTLCNKVSIQQLAILSK